MDNNIESSTTVTHNDSFQKFIETDNDGEYEVDITYKRKRQGKEGYGSVADRGEDIHLESPVDDIDELKHRTHIEVQLAIENQRTQQVPTNPTQANTEFDNAILDTFQYACNESGVLAIDENFPINLPELKTVFLHDARKTNSWPAITRHLEATEPTAKLLGFEPVPDQSHFWRAHQSLKNAGLRQQVRNASLRAFHAVLRSGIPIPEDVLTRYDITLAAVLDERHISPDTRRSAICNWGGRFFNRIEDSLEFDRADNSSCSMREFFGLLAHAALQGTSVYQGNTAGWFYDDDVIPSGDGLYYHINNMDTRAIEEMFKAANLSVLDMAADRGIFDAGSDSTATPQFDVAFDLHGVNWYGESDTWTVGTRYQNNSREDLKSVALTLMTNEARFAVGMYPTEKKSMKKVKGLLQRLMKIAEQAIPVNRIFMDREFSKGAAIDHCRDLVGNNWVIQAKAEDGGVIEELLEEATEYEPEIRRDVDFAGVTPPPNAFAAPVSDKEVGGEKRDHEAFFTDLPVEEIDVRELADQYDDRWNVETFLRQKKHDLTPNTRTSNPLIRTFCLNTAVLFYNLHTLMNRAPSPEYALRLNASMQEVLTGIRHVAFAQKPDPYL